jgi:Cft2 family RNA processing exonuclease
MKGNCSNCNKEIKIVANRSTTGMCRDCYQGSPLIKDNNKKIARQTKVRTTGFSDWKILKDKKQLLVDVETKIDQHQAFIYKILAERIQEVHDDFQRKAFTYWKLLEIIEFLEDFSKKHSV